MAPTSVLVLGAGELGQQVIQSLDGHSLRSNVTLAVLLRSSTIQSSDEIKRKQIEGFRSRGIDLVEGDVINDSEDRLTDIFSRFHTVINCCGMYLPAGSQIRIARAVVASDCRRYFPWQFGIDYDIIGRNSSQNLFDEQLDVRDLLRGQSKIKFLIVSTGMFLSFLFESAFGIVNEDRDTVSAIGSWENRITVTSPEDIGKLTAEIALAHPELEDVVFVAGDTVSMRDIANIVEKVRGTSVERQLNDVPELKRQLANDPENGMRKYRVVFAEGVGVAWDKSKSFNGLNGISTQTVLQWQVTFLTQHFKCLSKPQGTP